MPLYKVREIIMDQYEPNDICFTTFGTDYRNPGLFLKKIGARALYHP
jgi:hypothetical protein